MDVSALLDKLRKVHGTQAADPVPPPALSMQAAPAPPAASLGPTPAPAPTGGQMDPQDLLAAIMAGRAKPPADYVTRPAEPVPDAAPPPAPVAAAPTAPTEAPPHKSRFSPQDLEKMSLYGAQALDSTHEGAQALADNLNAASDQYNGHYSGGFHAKPGEPNQAVKELLQQRQLDEEQKAEAARTQRKADLPDILAKLPAFEGVDPKLLGKLEEPDVARYEKGYADRLTAKEAARKAQHDEEQAKKDEKHLVTEEERAAEAARNDKEKNAQEWYKLHHPPEKGDKAAGKENAKEKEHLAALQDAKAEAAAYKAALASGADDQTLRAHHDNLVLKMREVQKRAPNGGAAATAMLAQIPDSGRIGGKLKSTVGYEDPSKALDLMNTNLEREIAARSHDAGSTGGGEGTLTPVRKQVGGKTYEKRSDGWHEVGGG